MQGQRNALIVASDEYEHAGLRRLRSPAADAAALSRVLGDPQIGDFHVQVVRNQPAHVVQARIEDLFSEGRRDDVLLLHLSCHGLKSESGELYFAARNTRPNRLGSTAVSADFVQRCLRASRSRSIVLLLDCCYGGAFSQGVSIRASGDVNVLDNFPGGRLGGGRARAVITASSAIEYAFEGDHLADDHSGQPSVFTSALVDGLATGEADLNEDGWVSLNELYDYVFDRVRAQNPHQTPSRDVEMSGELYLARSRRRRVRPEPVPPDLRAAITDANMFARLGAVSELRTRLTNDNLPVAAGAYEALTDIARTDIRYVAVAASAALRDAALQALEPALHFGRVPQHSPPPRRTVHLLGPPLARVGNPQVSDSWLRVEATPEGFDVSVDTSVVGARRGDVTITGPTGEATIPVDVEVTPALVAPSATPTRPESAGPADPPTTVPAEPAPAQASGATADASEAEAALQAPWHARIGPPHRSEFVAGGFSVAIGLLLLAIRPYDDDFAALIVLWTVGYGLFLIVQALDAGGAAGVRRALLAGLGAWALLAVALFVGSEVWQPLASFFLVSGVVHVLLAVVAGVRPTRRLELVSGLLGTAAGTAVLRFAYADDDRIVTAVGGWLTVLGILLVVVALRERSAARSAASEALRGAGPGSR